VKQALLCCMLALSLTSLGCADGTLVFGGGNSTGSKDETVTLGGDIDDMLVDTGGGGVTAPPAGRDIVVFVYSNLRWENGGSTTKFADIDFTQPPGNALTLADFTFSDVEAVIIASGSRTFELSDITKGDLTVMFLLDDKDPDGQINTGDLVAVVDDPDDKLRDVAGSRNVTLEGVDVTFSTTFPYFGATPTKIRISTQTTTSP